MLRNLLILAMALCTPVFAQAHVKWFSKMVDCRSQPLAPLDVLRSPWFVVAALLTLVAIYATSVVDRRVSWRNNIATRLQLKLAGSAVKWVVPLLRLGIATYFVSIATYYWPHPVLLTPELMVNGMWVSLLQLLIAGAALRQSTSSLAAGGIIVLFTVAVVQYGIFHMFDYVFFLGIAAFLVLNGPGSGKRYSLGLWLLRSTMAFSLMWAGAEKWAYPLWTTDLLAGDLASVLMGLDPHFFVVVAGFIEFALAFLLLFGRLSSQIASSVLQLVMIAAIPMVGVVDAIGHALILTILTVLTVTTNVVSFHPESRGAKWGALALPLSFAILVPGVVGLYFLAHEVAYKHLLANSLGVQLLASLLSLLLVLRLFQMKPRFFRHRNFSRRHKKRAASARQVRPTPLKRRLRGLPTAMPQACQTPNPASRKPMPSSISLPTAAL